MSKEQILTLRQATGAGIVDIQKALEEAQGDEGKALEILRQRGQAKALKKQDRETREGLVHAYVHANGRVGVLVEVACETDFVARNKDFQNFAHELALQVYREELQSTGKLKGKTEEMVTKILEGKLGKYFVEACLLEQPSIKDESRTVRDLLTEITSKVGEKVEVKRFVRFAIGE